MALKSVGVAWFTSLTDSIGIVLALNETTKELKAYIGRVSGADVDEDIETIKVSGAKFPVKAAVAAVQASGTLEVTPKALDEYRVAW